MLLKASSIVLLVCMFVMVYRIATASSLYDRILALNVFNTCAVIAIMVLGVVVEEAHYFIDISLTYACVGLVSVVGFARFFFCKEWGSGGK